MPLEYFHTNNSLCIYRINFVAKRQSKSSTIPICCEIVYWFYTIFCLCGSNNLDRWWFTTCIHAMLLSETDRNEFFHTPRHFPASSTRSSLIGLYFHFPSSPLRRDRCEFSPLLLHAIRLCFTLFNLYPWNVQPHNT